MKTVPCSRRDCPYAGRDHGHVEPTKAQARYLACSLFEAFYGGAAGGGKSVGLMFNALRWIQFPEYRGIIFRRTVPELKKYLIPRTEQLYGMIRGEKRGAIVRAKYFATDRLWEFPSGACVELGAMQYAADRFGFDSAEYQFVGFDELTTFEEIQYTYMVTRMRTTNPEIPLRLRSASNPGGIGHEWVQKRFEAWLGDPDGEREAWAKPGQKLAFYRADDESEEQQVPLGTPGAMTRTFFPATIDDNPHIDDGYADRLRATDLLTYQQKRWGNWMARAVAGMFFRRDFWDESKYLPAGFLAPDSIGRVRYWDLAATPSDKDDGIEDKGPDWLAGVRMCKRGRQHGLAIVVEDVARARVDESAVGAYILATADADAEDCGKGNVTHIIEQEPGASGKIAANALVRKLAGKGHSAKTVCPSGNKVDRAKPMAGLARAGGIYLVRGPWNRRLIAEAEMFPKGKKDQIDGLSGGGAELANVRPGKAKTGGRRPGASAQGGF